jgi:uncharacterized cupin superfamily protein
MKKFELFTLNNIDTPRFIMTPLELKDYIDFEVKRMYFMVQPKTGETGAHCHFKEKELFVMIQGSCIAIIDRGRGLEELEFRGPMHALYAANYVWHGFKNFSDDAILLALSSTNYNPDRSDYLENYDEYLKIRDEELAKE